MKDLTIFLVHKTTLAGRVHLINATLKMFDDILKPFGVKLLVETVDDYDPEKINLKDFENVIKYEKFNNDEIDKFIAPLGIEELSNILKHKEALRRCSISSNKFNIVLEDDCLIMESDKQHLIDMLKIVIENEFVNPFDMILLGVANKNIENSQNPQKQGIRKTQNEYKILPCKEAYIVTTNAAKIMLKTFETITLTMRYHLSWYMMNGTINIYNPVNRITIDGSKLGIFPSTIHSNNMLILNYEYMEMWKALANANNTDNINLPAIRKLYENVKELKSADIMHLFAVILFKCNKLKESQDFFNEAIKEMSIKNGLLNARSDLLLNTINFYKNAQFDIADIKSIPSKYASKPLL